MLFSTIQAAGVDVCSELYKHIVDGFLFRYPDNDSDKATEASHGDPAQEPAKQQSRETRAAPVLRVAGPSREALTGPVLRRRPLRDRRGMARGRTRRAV